MPSPIERSALDVRGLEDAPTELFDDLVEAPDPVAEAQLTRARGGAAEVRASVGPPWSGPAPQPPPPPVYPGVLSALIFAVRGAVGFAGGAGIADRGPPPERPHRST